MAKILNIQEREDQVLFSLILRSVSDATKNESKNSLRTSEKMNDRKYRQVYVPGDKMPIFAF